VVNCLSESKLQLEELVGRYKELEKNANFYQGKCMRFDREGIAFISKPTINLDDVVIPATVFKEFKLNCVDFLLDKDYHENVKKRGILLYGPPGVGKTSLISAGFNELVSNNISCCFVTTESFTKYPLQHVVNIVVEYLTPAVLVFEDIDLIGRERGSGYDGLVGELLNALNGIGEIREPLVVIGTTNRVEVLDQAVTRPCRFDRKLEIPYPKNGEVHKLFEKICGCLPPAIDFDKCKITGAHIREIYHTATLLKIKHKTGEIKDYIAEATEDVMKSFYLASPSVGFASDQDSPRPTIAMSNNSKQIEERDITDPFRFE
jgi:SpoVK/Ycf46/Vps4 family AAA+-type ATPase